jgi:hypothetical protein
MATRVDLKENVMDAGCEESQVVVMDTDAANHVSYTIDSFPE